MEQARILVTGGAGFIGSNIANELAKRNDVIAIDDCYLGHPENLTDDVEFSERSVLDNDLPTNVDVVIHLAALSSYGMHEDNSTQGTRVNVEGFVNVVEQAQQDGCETVVYASTSSIYGSQTEPSSENMEVMASTAYEASKLARERYAEYFSTHHNISMCGLRLFSVYQGYDGAEEHKDEYANVIAQFADNIARGHPPELYDDGTQTRDFIYIRDVVRAFEMAAKHELDGIYNIGTGRRVSFNELVKMLNEELGTDIKPEYVENPIPDDIYIRDTCADSTKFTNATGWNPEIPLETGLKRVCSAYTE